MSQTGCRKSGGSLPDFLRKASAMQSGNCAIAANNRAAMSQPFADPDITSNIGIKPVEHAGTFQERRDRVASTGTDLSYKKFHCAHSDLAIRQVRMCAMKFLV